ncbi:hypothetical protein [Celeribacter arenosi]|uniref:Ferrochelatase n=1 Tax=Celeribacter arenosi TaxID=792649 RepID=A0ABP7KF89_9RHOB
MKKIAVSAIVATFVATSAFAGGYSEPVIEAETVFVEEPTSGGWLVPLALIALFAVAAANSGSDTAVE